MIQILFRTNKQSEKEIEIAASNALRSSESKIMKWVYITYGSRNKNTNTRKIKKEKLNVS